MDRIKQVILIRRDLKMRRGKEIAQGSHAAVEFLVAQLRAKIGGGSGEPGGSDSDANSHAPATFRLALTVDELAWLRDGMAKVCVQVSSEEMLLDHHRKALEAGLKSFLIRDSGRTEFAGVPTYTACAIGPASAEKIDAVTGQLPLY